MRILLVDDDRELIDLLAFALTRAGLEPIAAHDASGAMRQYEEREPDLVVLDINLGNSNGLDVLKELRRRGQLPVIMLTALDSEEDKVRGLELGADDYLTKPFSIRELLARVRAIFRRIELQGQSASADASPPLLEEGSLRVDVGEHTASVDGQPLELTPKEFDLLVILVQNPGRAFARDYLLDKVWGYEYGGLDTRTVDTHVLRLRKKLGGVGDRIETVWGVGYRFARASQPLRAMAKEG
jgi:DNA-binding response OmpR family regulator